MTWYIPSASFCIAWMCSSRFPPSAWKGSTLCTPSCNVPEEEAESIQLTRSCRCRRRGDSHTELLLWKFSLEISQSGLQKSSERNKKKKKRGNLLFRSKEEEKRRRTYFLKRQFQLLIWRLLESPLVFDGTERSLSSRRSCSRGGYHLAVK